MLLAAYRSAKWLLHLYHMQHDVYIESLVYTGPGLGHLDDGKVVFVPGGLPGDIVRVEIASDRGRYAQGLLVEVLEATPHRVTAPCEYARVCGGCPWQELEYSHQLEWKRRFVVDALTRIGKIADAEELVEDTVPSPAQWHYRNKVEFSVFSTGRRLQLGMHEAGSANELAVERCLLLPESLAELPKLLSGTLNYAMNNEAVWPYRVGIRHSERTGQNELALWSLPTGMRRAFIASLLEKSLPADSMVRVLTRADDSSRDVTKTEVLSGNGYWTERLAGLSYRISAPSFFQVNTDVADLMVDTVLDLARTHLGGDIAGKAIWDLYSGAGSFTLPLAAAGALVSAVEIAGSSIRDLRRNLETHNLGDEVDVFPGDVARVLPQLSACDMAVVDPPASGLDRQVIHSIADADVRDLIYVSCDPQTLARDTQLLTRLGYHLLSARPFDLFPQTYHVECVAHLTRR